jgi:hypothetical protein
MLSVRGKCLTFFVRFYPKAASTNSSKNSKYQFSRESVQYEYWYNKQQEREDKADSLYSHLFGDRSEIVRRNEVLLTDLTVKVKVKVQFALEQATKAQRGSRYSSTPSLTSVLDGVGKSTPRPGRFTPGKHPVPLV